MTQASETSLRRAVLVAATLTAFLIPFMDSATTVALPAIGREFSMDTILLSWIRTAYLLAAAMCLVPIGKLADIYGRKRIFTYGTVIFALTALALGWAISPTMLIALRAVQGVGGAMIFGTGMAILTSAFPPAERGRVLGLNVAAVYLGLSLGPSIGGFLTGLLGWRSIFFLTAALVLLVIVFVARRLRQEWAEARGERFDLAGSAVYGVSLVCLMYGFTRLPACLGYTLIGAGLAGLVLFAWWQTRVSFPVLNVRMLVRNRPFALSNLAAMINYSATSAVAFLLSLYLQSIRALTPQQAGLILLAQPIVQAALSPSAGWLSDRVEPRIVASAGMAITAVGLALFALIGFTSPVGVIVALLALLGLGFALFSSPNMNAIMGSVDRSSYGVASGMLGTMRLVGQMLSMGITTLLIALYLGPVQLVPEVHPQFLQSMRAAFTIFSALCLAGVFASLARGRIRAEHDTESRPAPIASAPDH